MSCCAKSCSSSANFRKSAPRSAGPVSTWVGRVAASAHRTLQRRRQRSALLELDDRRLNDIGLTRDQALKEARKPLWR